MLHRAPRMLFVTGTIASALLSDVTMCHGQQDAHDLAASTAAAQAPESRIATSIPVPITEREVMRYSRMLQLAPEQCTFLDQFYSEYSERYRNMYGDMYPVHDKLAVEAGRIQTHEGHSPAFASAHEALIEHEQGIRKRISDLDDWLLGTLSSVLSESQLESLPRVMRTRARERCFPLYVFINSAQIDLSRLIEDTELDEHLLDALDPVLLEYEFKVTPLFLELRRKIDRDAVSGTWGLANAVYDANGETYETGSPAAAAAANAYFAHVKSVQEPMARIETRIASLNEEYVAQMLELLPAAERRSVEFKFKRRAYPDAYPDGTDPQPIHDLIVQSAHLNFDDLDIYLELWNAYRNGYDSICKAMVKENERWREHLEATLNSSAWGEYQLKMAELREKRWRANASILKQIVDNLGDKLPHKILEQMQDHRDRVERYVEAVTRDRPPVPEKSIP